MGARFSPPVQIGSETHSASYTIGTGSFPGAKRPGRGVDHPPHLAPRLKKEYSYTPTPPWAFVAGSRVNFTFTFTRGEQVVQKSRIKLEILMLETELIKKTNSCTLLKLHFFKNTVL
jgi:hypothetical protein